jgi:penicillin amidase
VAALRADDRTFVASLNMSHASDWKSFVAALRDFHSPQQNIVYADVDGNIGYIAPGRVPLRRPDNDLMGLAPAPGWDARYDWQGFIPFEQLPRRFNPPEGMIVTANQKIVGDDYPYFITSEWTVPYRYQRIRTLLEAEPHHTKDTFAAIQKDVVSLAVRDALPLLLAAPVATDATRPPRERALLDALRKWDGTMSADRAEPLVVTAWLRELSRLLFEDKVGESQFNRLWEQRNVQLPMLNAMRDPKGLGAFWCDNSRTPAHESCADTIGLAWQRAIADLDRRYGEDTAKWRGARRTPRVPSTSRSARCRTCPACSTCACHRRRYVYGGCGPPQPPRRARTIREHARGQSARHLRSGRSVGVAFHDVDRTVWQCAVAALPRLDRGVGRRAVHHDWRPPAQSGRRQL